jgi:hypothetical protein
VHGGSFGQVITDFDPLRLQGADRKLPQQAGWRKLLSPWLFVVAGAFLLGAYTCSSGALTQKSGRKTDAGAGLRKDKPAAAKKAKKPKRAAVVEDEEEDVEEAAAPAASAVILANQAPAPPKPDGATRSVTFFDGNTVNVYPHVDQGSGNADWWGAVTAGWETDSLHAIKLFLQLKRKTQKHVVEVDFGCWVGPTVLFAGAYADKIYAMEPDPGAYREVSRLCCVAAGTQMWGLRSPRPRQLGHLLQGAPGVRAVHTTSVPDRCLLAGPHLLPCFPRP